MLFNVSGVSFLERLMNDNPLYKKKEDGSGYDPKFITKLVQNFRSHEAILRIPNKLFYDNELEVKYHFHRHYLLWTTTKLTGAKLD